VQRAVLVTLAIVSLLLGIWLCCLRGPESAPMVRLAPAQPIRGDAPPQPAAGPPPAVPLHPEPELRTDRTPRPADALAAAVEVRLIDPNGAPVTDVEVGLSVAATDSAPEFAAVAPTDATGSARFEVPGGAGRRAAAFSACSGQLETDLRAGADNLLLLRCVHRCWVEGTVVTASGHGVGGACLVLLPWHERPGHHLPATLRVGRSRADGSFRLPLAHGGRLGAQHPDYSPSALRTVRLAGSPGEPATTVSLRLVLITLQARAQGSVRDAAGRTVPDAELEFRCLEPRTGELAAAPQRSHTDPAGNFRVAHLLPGEVTWVTRARGHGTARGHFAVAAGQTADLRIELPPAAAVRGTVQDEAGRPVAGAAVHSGTAGTFASQRTTAAGDGTFLLPDLAPGPTDLTATEPPPASGPARSTRARLELRAGEVADWVAVLAAPVAGPALRGTLVDDRGERLANWRLTVVQPGREPRLGSSGADGGFAVALAGAQPAQVLVHAPDQPPASFPAAQFRLAEPAAAPHQLVVDRTAQGATVRGLVESAGGGGTAATVAVWHHGMQRSAYTEAGRDGRFRVDRVPAGTFDLFVDMPGHVGLVRHDLAIAPGADLDLGTLVLGLAAALHGTVIGPDDQPPEQLEIYVLTQDQRIAAEYAGGTYRLGRLPPGRHVLQAQGRGVATAAFPIEVGEGVELQQDLRLAAGVSRRFEVAAPETAGSFVSLAVRVPGQPQQWLAGQPRPGSGIAAFTAWMAPGSYEVVAWAAAGWSARATVVFDAAENAPLRLDLRRE